MGTKTLVKQWKSYLSNLAQTGHTLPEMEALRPFMGARGNVLKRQTRSKKQQAAFKQAAAGVKAKHGTKRSAAYFKKTAKFRKQQETFAKNQATAKARQQHKKKPDFSGPLSESAKRTIKEAEDRYARMVDILDRGSRKALSAKVRYEVYANEDLEEVSDEDLAEFFDKMIEALEDIPEEAKILNKQDDFYQVLIKLQEMGIEEKEDLKAMFKALVDYPTDHDSVLEAIDAWQDYNPNGIGFDQFMDQLEGYNDMWNPDNYEEILQTEE